MAEPQPITDARKDSSIMGIASGLGRDFVQQPMNSKVHHLRSDLVEMCSFRAGSRYTLH